MNKPNYVEHPIVSKDRNTYEDVVVDVSKAIESYRLSIMSFEVLDRSGSIKSDEDVDVAEQAVREGIREKIKNSQTLEKPIIGLGLHDNFEIGVGRSVFITLAYEGETEIPAHVRKTQAEHLKKFIK